MSLLFANPEDVFSTQGSYYNTFKNLTIEGYDSLFLAHIKKVKTQNKEKNLTPLDSCAGISNSLHAG